MLADAAFALALDLQALEAAIEGGPADERREPQQIGREHVGRPVVALVDPAGPDQADEARERCDTQPARQGRLDERVGEVGEEAVEAHVRQDVAAGEARAAERPDGDLDLRRERPLTLRERLDRRRQGAVRPGAQAEQGLEAIPRRPERREDGRRDQAALGREARP